MSPEEFKYLLDESEPCFVPFDDEGNPNDPEKWVGTWTINATPEVAQELCAGCHVQEQCLQYALDNDERDFIYGGTTAEERKEMKRGIG